MQKHYDKVKQLLQNLANLFQTWMSVSTANRRSDKSFWCKKDHRNSGMRKAGALGPGLKIWPPPLLAVDAFLCKFSFLFSVPPIVLGLMSVSIKDCFTLFNRKRNLSIYCINLIQEEKSFSLVYHQWCKMYFGAHFILKM